MSSFRPTRTAAVLGLCLALGPICAGLFIYKGILAFKSADRYITVKGLVERVEKADKGLFNIHFKVSGNDLPQLYATLATTTQLTQDFLMKEGFEEKEIERGAPDFTDNQATPQYGNQTTPSERYVINSRIAVDSTKVDTLQALSGKLADLIAQGVPVTSSTLNFYLEKFNNLRPQLIIEATKNARQMGENIASATGHTLGGIRRVNQGVITLTSPYAAPDQNYSDMSSLMKKIRVLATVEFFID